MTSSSSSLSPPPFPSCAGDSPLSTTASIVGILTFALGLLASYIALQSATRGAPSEIARLVDDLRSTQREINRVAEYIFDDAHQHAVPPPPPPPPLANGVVKEKEKATGRFDGNGSGSSGRRQDDHRGVTSGMREAASSIDSSNNNNKSKSSSSSSSSTSTIATTAAAWLPPPPSSLAVPPPTSSSSMSHLYTETQSLLASCIRLLIEADSMLQSVSSDSSRWDPEGLRRRIVFVMNRHEVSEKMQRLREQKEKLAGVQMSLFMRKSVVQEGVLREVRERLGGLEGRVWGMGRGREEYGEGKMGSGESDDE